MPTKGELHSSIQGIVDENPGWHKKVLFLESLLIVKVLYEPLNRVRKEELERALEIVNRIKGEGRESNGQAEVTGQAEKTAQERVFPDDATAAVESPTGSAGSLGIGPEL